MPYEDGKLTEEEYQNVVRWIESKLPSAKCSLCGNETIWTIEDYLVTVQTSEEMISGTADFELKAYPFVLFRCDVCSQTFFLNAIAIGILEDGYNG